MINNNTNMNRRDALKLMGTTALGLAMTATGASTLASCVDKKKKRLILYFTGTGNCLYIARQLADKETELLSIPQLMKDHKFAFDADEIGLIYPMYGHMPPNMVRKFIQKAKLNADYKFTVITYGNRKCNAVGIWDGITEKAGNKFDYISTLIMVDNWLPNFDMNEQMKIDKHIPESLQKITADLNTKKKWHEPFTEEEVQQHQGFLDYTGIDPEVGFFVKSEKYFEVTDACINCGICTYVCPQGNYKQGPGIATMAGDCEFCFSCIQNCPQKAIRFAPNPDDVLLSKGELNPKARYRNENISLMDIKKANDQQKR